MQRTLVRILALFCLAVVWGLTPAWADTPQPQDMQQQRDMRQPPATPVATEPTVRIETAAVCQDVVDRMPVASGEVFARQIPQLYCWSRVVGAADETFITHNWYYKGSLKASVQLPVRSNNWRTWSAKSMDPEWTGEWMVEILSAEGVPLESIVFVVQ